MCYNENYNFAKIRMMMQLQDNKKKQFTAQLTYRVNLHNNEN